MSEAKIIYLGPPSYREALSHFSHHFEACVDCSDDGLCLQGIALAQIAWAHLNVVPKACAKKAPIHLKEV